MPKIKFNPNNLTAKNIAELHGALKKIDLNISKDELEKKNIGTSTIEAIKEIQRKNNLDTNGKIDEKTIEVINKELFDASYARNKKKSEKVQTLLEKTGVTVAPEEKKKHVIGENTRKAIAEFKRNSGLTPDDKITGDLLEKLEEAAIKKTFTTKTQINKLQSTIERAAKVAKLDIKISEEEKKNKSLGSSSSEALKKIQEKYKLPVTGQLDKATLEKIESIAVSRGVNKKMLKVKEATQLKPVTTPLRLNMVSSKVSELQKTLSYIGFPIEEKEFKTQKFGKTTREALLAFQNKKGLPETGQFDKHTKKALNAELIASNPKAEAAILKFRIRGSVRDEKLNRKGNMVIQIYEKLLDGESTEPLTTKKNHSNGFFDITYNPPIDKITGKPKEKFHLLVKLLDSNNKFIDQQTHYNVSRIYWVNFNLGGASYKGETDYSATSSLLSKALGDKNILEIQETPEKQQITQLSLETGLSTDDIMRFILSHRAAKNINKDALTPEVFYAFIRQNLPPALPGDLLRGTNNWEAIDQLTELAANGIIFTEDFLTEQAIENALNENLVSQAVSINKATILQEIKNVRSTFALEKPILTGNGNLKTLLEHSSIQQNHYGTIASLFVANKGLNENFWKELNAQAGNIGANEVKDFTATVELGNITKNHIPTIQFLKNNIGTDPSKKFKSVRDIAKLDQPELIQAINDNGKNIPDNIPGNTIDEKVATYANVLKSRAEFMFPAVALVAAVKKGNGSNFQKLNEVEKFVDDNAEFNFRTQNLDKYLLDKNIQIENKAVEEIKVFQRIQKLSTQSLAGKTLIEENLHSSSQIYFTGKDRLVNRMKEKGVEPKTAYKIYEAAKMQYSQVLDKLLDYSSSINFGTPQSINSPTITAEEIKNTIGDIPNLEQLFGSLDYCECEHCKSLYGPPAYFTDLLRFLKEHDSLITEAGKVLNVKDILFDRRPDLGNIKLNCENTNTPMPYIDLVCEILENNIAPQQKDFSYQTTLNANELAAIPQYIRPHAYEVIKDADFPMNSSFNLWQEETRTYLNFLKAPRYKIMEAFQDISNPATPNPSNVSIAAEYFCISSKEETLINTEVSSNTDLDNYWGLDTTQTSVPVSIFMKRSKLSYYEVLDLLLVKFVNDPDQPNKSVIERPADTCDVSEQTVTNLSIEKFDKMHRFLRLWRKTDWKMWELDLLIRNNKIGKNKIGEDSSTDVHTLVRLKQFKQLSDKLNLPLEVILAFYNNINAEERIKPDKPDVKISPLYHQLFQNQAITNPIDDHFKIDPSSLSLVDETLPLSLNAGYTPIPTILSALAIRQVELDLLRPQTDGKLSMNSLSALLRYTYLARGLKIQIKDLLLLLDLTSTTNPFESLTTTLAFIEKFESIKKAGISPLDLDYVLNYRPDSPMGLRTETIAQYIEGVRESLAKNKEAIDELKLTESSKNEILNFNTTNLTPPLTNAEIVAMILPLENTLATVHDGFVSSSFSVEETEYILSVDHNVPASLNKDHLIDNIKKLQDNIADLLKQNNNQIIAQVASSFALTLQQAEFLLKNLQMTGETKSLLELISNDALLEKNADGTYKQINPSNYPKQFNIFSLLHKISLLLQRMKTSINNLEYFQTNNAILNTLDLAALPVTGVVTANTFDKWENLNKFIDFTSQYPEPEDASMRAVLDKAKDTAATKDDIFAPLSKLTQWNSLELVSLDTVLQLKHTAAENDYLNSDTYFRLQQCLAQMKNTGVNAEMMFKWTQRDDVSIQNEIALETRQAVKSKYEKEDWLNKIAPMQDDIREKKRKALVAYHLEESQRTQPVKITVDGQEMPNPLYWNDSNALYKYFLIDVEMGAIQATSRIKQAISSVQLFVQRCFLNLENRFVQVSQGEKEDTSSENSWAQWKWMKNYRIWEANRKIFFYPENWIEPELRDDKSPFFEELENEILQNDITHENVEAAFVNYLYKADEVAHLEVVGFYHQMEELNVHELGYEINLVHVIGRTKEIPALYYYRTYDVNYATWSAWEKIEGEITGDHVVPVVYNRKLHLFWLVITEKAQKANKVPPAKPSAGPTDAPEPQKLLEVQLAWMVKKEKGWSSKKISKEKIIHPWERPHHSYNLKPYYKASTNELWLDIYLSTSKEFNDKKFYDPFSDSRVYITGNRFNETYLPWHSSSFVFDGKVKDLKLKGLQGYFHLEFNILGSNVNLNIPSPTTSYDFVSSNFGEDGRKLKIFQPNEDGPRLGLPTGMHFHNTHLRNNKYQNVNPKELRVLENGSTTTLLKNTEDPFDLIIAQQELQFNTLYDHPLFYQDNKRAFFIKPEWNQLFDEYGQFINNIRNYRFLPFYHPYTMLFIRELNRTGIDGLLNRKIQTKPESYVPVNDFDFSSYQPTSIAVADKTAKKDMVDFSLNGAYSIYNWEIFFHAPLMIATRLTQNQRFEEAMRWFHYIFDPTNIEAISSPQRYWVTKPFYEQNSEDYRKQRIENIISNINLEENKAQLKAWRNNPFKPHLIARLRPVAYQRNVVMKYIDNLVAWGDQLFRRDTIESINEASLLYMLAYEILGERPQKVPNVKHEDFTFNEIEAKLDALGNASVDVQIEDTLLPIKVVPSSDGSIPMPKIETLYFGIPNNENILKYWDTVEDRLFKIRNSMNLEGIVRKLALFEPPIDPALLVKAAAAGIDLSSVLNDIETGVPHLRFRVVLQKAVEFCAEVRAMGDKLLMVLEKKDAEGLSLLRSQHEIELLEAVREIRKKQIDETVEIWGGLEKAKSLAEEKKSYYEGRDFINALETASVALSGGSAAITGLTSISDFIASTLHLIPSFSIGISGFGGTPNVTMSVGGGMLASSTQAAGSGYQRIGTALSQVAGILNTLALYQRRKDDWEFNGRLATIEVDQLQFQINAAQIRKAIAEKEMDNQDLQIDHAKTTDDYMKNKYTNQQLYSWMLTQVSSVYFQSYQLAYDLAKKAEKCYQYELGIQNSSFIQFGYWDSLRKGLMSGEKLMYDLRRLEAAYMEQNKREQEINKNISLAQIAPVSLLKLKETGECLLTLPEWLFDMDYPGQYMRRIKSVSVSIPCITGPFTSINCTLSLLKNETRMDNTLSGGSYPKVDDNDTRFRIKFGSASYISTSHAQNDNGMFELNFNDERYLPFEGAGVISDWQIKLPRETNYFDFESLSDVILHINYTSRNGGDTLANPAKAQLQSILPNSTAKLFSLKHDFGTEWYKFLNPNGNADQELVFNIKPEHYPFFLRNNIQNLKLKKIEFFVESSQVGNFEMLLKATNTDYETSPTDVAPDPAFNNVHSTNRDYSASPKPNAIGEVRIKLKLKEGTDFKSLLSQQIDDLFMLCHVSV